MADPKSILEMEFNSKAVEIRTVDPGRLEPDDFVINDIPLRIPPEQIIVQKESFNHEWNTLRTRESRNAKSGYGIARVGISTIFRVNKVGNNYDEEALRLVVAGLRATPFCVVYSRYLDNMLGRPDDETPVATGETSSTYSKPFQPIMLALASMTFSTLGHEGKPDCIRADFDFLWFNYLPFTKYIAFKSGPELNKPGFPWQSGIWKAFYEPFTYQIPLDFPHHIASEDRVTEFMWREFLLIPKGNPKAVQAASDIAKALQNKPNQILDIFHNIIQQGTVINDAERSDLRNPDVINAGILDTLYRRAVKKGVITPSDEVRQYLSEMPDGAITEAGGSILAPVFQQVYGTTGPVVGQRSWNDLDIAANLLANRVKELTSIQQRGDVVFKTIDNDGVYQQLLDANARYGNKGTNFVAGGLNLFGRKQRLSISHKYDTGDFKPNAVIQQIVVSFRNTLATIPMLAYRYPTIQHVGSMDAQVTMVINATNFAAKSIREMYDRVETTALRYKQIPAGFTNLNIRNDFLNTFGVDEFLTERLDINTIPDQPGRSLINLTLIDAGLTSKTKDPEDIQQEFVQGDTDIYKGIWKVLVKNMEPSGGYAGTSFGTPKIVKDTEADYYKIKLFGTKQTGDSVAYASLVQRAINIHNDFLKEVHNNTFGEDNITGNINYGIFMNLEENTAGIGYLPGVKLVQRTLQKRNKAYSDATEKKKMRSIRFENDKSRAAQARARTIATKYSGNAAFAAKNKPDFEKRTEAEDLTSKRLTKMGVYVYAQKMRALLQEINQKHLTLSEFKHLLELRDKLGLDSGLMAYPDFREQLSSVAKAVEGTRQRNDLDLMKYDPDCYFYYPILHGGTDSSLTSIIDPHYLNTAQQYSKQIYDNAVDRIEEFFNSTYQDRINNPQNLRPYDTLEKKMPNPLYFDDGLITNSTKSEKIKKTVVPDPQSKISTNWYPFPNPGIESPNLCQHTTNMNQLWDGVTSDTNGSAGSSGGGDIVTPSLEQSKGKGKWIEEASPALKNPERWPKLKQLRVEAQPIFERVLDQMVASGYQPDVWDVYRSPAKQKEKVLQGFSQPSVTKKAKQWLKEGRLPAGTSLREARRILIERGVVELRTGYHTYGLAVDIIPKGYNWKKADPQTAQFLKALRNIASRNGLNCGGFWTSRESVWSKYGIGWDPWHCQLDRYQGRKISREWRQDVMQDRRRRASGQRYQPPVSKSKQLAAKKTQPIDRGVTSTISSPLRLAIQEFERDLYNGQAQSMMRAYPAFKLYFVEEDSGEERKRLQFDDFFSYQAVQSIRVIRSRKIAADLCEIYLTNISGVLSNRKFRNSRKSDQPMNKQGKVTKEQAANSNTREENPIASLLLQQGQHVHLRMGYTSDPSRMETVFNGVITEVQFSESDDLVRIVAQSYAIELVQDLKGVQKPVKKTSSAYFGWDKWGFGSEATTGRILEEMLAEPEVLHFGRWTATGGGDNPSRELLTQRWTFTPQPQDDNIFAPSNSQDMERLADGVFFKNLKYIIYRTTIWDICQEMTMRHPNFIASPVPYKGQKGERMTMFYGLPNQLYFYRDPNAEEQVADAKLERIQKEASKGITDDARKLQKKVLVDHLKQKISRGTYWAKGYRHLKNPTDDQINIQAEKLLSREIKIVGSDVEKLLQNAVSNFYKEQRLNQAKQAGYIKPFRNYHLVTSSQHLVQNNIRANARDVANTIVIKYGEDVEVTDDASGEKLNGLAIKGDEQEFTLKLDAALPTEETRTQMGQFINVTNPDLAKRYALSLLMRNCKDIYKGEIVIVGNPKMKPYDVCLVAGTKILTADGYQNIEDIKIRDVVFSHKGKQQKVDQLFVRNHHEKILKIRCNSDPEDIEITANHPVLSVLRKDIYPNGKSWSKTDNFIPKWRPIGTLNKKDYLAQPRLLTDKSLPVPLARLLGYYLAEGNIIWEWRKSFNKKNKYNRKSNSSEIKCCRVPVAIQWSFNSEEEFFMVDEINNLLKQLNYKKTVQHYIVDEKKDLRIIFYDRNLTSLFIKLVGYSDREGPKKDNKWIRNFYNIDTTKHILAAYFEGDGCFLNKEKIAASTSKFNLGRNIRQMLINIGIPVGSSISNGKSFKKNCKAYNNVIPFSCTYQFAGYFFSNSRFSPINDFKQIHKCPSTTSIVDDLFVYLPISKIQESKNQNQPVYNIGVANDNSYIAQNKAVHNCYLFDEYTDMIGAFEIEEVQHIFDQQHGFRTEIKPDMLVQAQEFSLLGSAEALGVVMEGALRKMGKSNGAALGKSLSPSSFILGHGINFVGGFLAQKLINFTQLAQPIIMSPLLHHGRMFTGGVPVKKIPTSAWETTFAKWSSTSDSGYSDWVEDTKEEILGWLRTKTFQNTVGSFFNSGGDTPE